MKKTWWILTLLLLISYQARPQNNQFTVQGIIANASVRMLYLRYTDTSGTDKVDSAFIQNGSFLFRGSINQPTRAILRANRKMIPDDQNLNITLLYLEPAIIKVQLVYDHFRDIKVAGSKTHQSNDELNARKAVTMQEIRLLQDSLNRLTEHNLSSLNPADIEVQRTRINRSIRQLANKLGMISYQFIEEFPASWVSISELNLYKNSWAIDSVRYLFNGLSSPIQHSLDGQQVATKLAFSDQAKSSIGSHAIDFSAIDVKGDSIKLSTYRGRYVLLDFWGSWCAPCRAGNPHLLDLYKKYQPKGVEFIGIACQDASVAWKKAIDKDGIGIWKHILDIEAKITNSNQRLSIRQRYAVDSFPTKILIDPTGAVIGRYNGNDEAIMDKKMAELLN
ncbi:redoxin domain-containing protein [Spirosoma flavum]|uniref:Redoxin domain-containing protein n=1 Tax=Spirosoma flavum TaxID=2048557 RepID=A0ABW6APU3_9BACT